jgi:DNA-binding NarL/FixJ family response regulator
VAAVLRSEVRSEPSEPDTSATGREKPTVFILSDVRLYREGLSWNLVREGSLDIVGASEQSDRTFACLRALKPAAIILDITIANSLQLARSLRSQLPRTKLVAFAVTNVECELLTGATAGISGYVHRDGDIKDLVSEVMHAVDGELHCSPRHAALLLEKIALLSDSDVGLGKNGSDGLTRQPLTRREAEILDYVERGLSNKEIARTLKISHATVKNHVHHIFEKLHVHRRTQALARLRELRVEPTANVM